MKMSIAVIYVCKYILIESTILYEKIVLLRVYFFDLQWYILFYYEPFYFYTVIDLIILFVFLYRILPTSIMVNNFRFSQNF